MAAPELSDALGEQGSVGSPSLRCPAAMAMGKSPVFFSFSWSSHSPRRCHGTCYGPLTQKFLQSVWGPADLPANSWCSYSPAETWGKSVDPPKGFLVSKHSKACLAAADPAHSSGKYHIFKHCVSLL